MGTKCTKCRFDGTVIEGKCYAALCTTERKCNSRYKNGSPRYAKTLEERKLRAK